MDAETKRCYCRLLNKKASLERELKQASRMFKRSIPPLSVKNLEQCENINRLVNALYDINQILKGESFKHPCR